MLSLILHPPPFHLRTHAWSSSATPLSASPSPISYISLIRISMKAPSHSSDPSMLATKGSLASPFATTSTDSCVTILLIYTTWSMNLHSLSIGCLAVFGGAVKAPKVLADMVESIAAAVYIDYGFDIKAFWTVFKGFLEPIVTWEILQEQPQPVKKLFQLCQKQKKQIHFKQWKEDEVCQCLCR